MMRTSSPSYIRRNIRPKLFGVLATNPPLIDMWSAVGISDERAGLLYQRHCSLHDFAFIAVSQNWSLSLIRLVGRWSVGEGAVACPSQSRKFGGIVNGVDFRKPFPQLSPLDDVADSSEISNNFSVAKLSG